jgi:hypothetical protein
MIITLHHAGREKFEDFKTYFRIKDSKDSKRQRAHPI